MKKFCENRKRARNVRGEPRLTPEMILFASSSLKLIKLDIDVN